MALRKPSKTSNREIPAEQPVPKAQDQSPVTSEDIQSKPARRKPVGRPKRPAAVTEPAPQVEIATAGPAPSPRNTKSKHKKSPHLAVAVPARHELEAQLAAEVEAMAETEFETMTYATTAQPRSPKKAAKSAETATTASPAVPASLTPQAKIALEAISQGQAIELIFLDSENIPPRTFEPRQLIFDVFTNAWFIWGWDRRYNAERHHRLDQFAQINLVDGVGRSAQGPFLEDTPPNQIGGWRGGEAIHVKAVLMKQWIFAVKQAPAPFPDFHIEETEDGKAMITFVGTDLRAIARWCMQFGDGIQILEPARLVDRMRQVALAWGAKLPPPAAVANESRHEPARPEPRNESRPEPRPEPRHETRPEPRSEHRHEPKPERPEHRERSNDSRRPDFSREEPAKKAPKVEIRFERL